MSDHSQFSADVATLNKIAEVDLPQVAGELGTSTEPVLTHAAGNTAPAAFGAAVPDAVALAQKFEALLAALGAEAGAIKGSLDTAASNLKQIADNYERVDTELAGS